MPNDVAAFWDERAKAQGHTGWANPSIYRYDQPVRVRAVVGTVRSLYSDLAKLRLLDVGCGTGDMSVALADVGVDVLGTDFSSIVIETAKRRVRGRANLRFVVASIDSIEPSEVSFDLALSITVLQHLTDPAALRGTLAHLHSLLRPGGYLIALEFAPTGGRQGRNVGHLATRTPAEWVNAFEEAGLSLTSQHSYPQWAVVLLARLSRSRSHGERDPGESASPVTRLVNRVATSLVLAVAAPFDHLLRLPIPTRWADYRIMVAQRPAG